MRVRQYLIASLILHAVLITAAFSVFYRERACPLPIDCMEVSFVEELGLDSFFSKPLHDNVKSHSEMKKEFQKRIAFRAPTNLFLSPKSTEHDVLNSVEKNQDRRGIQDFENAVNVGKSQSKADEGGGTNVVFNSPHESSLSQGMHTESNHSGVTEGMAASQGTTLPSLNTHQQDFRGNDFYRAIRTLLERARSYPLLARKRGMEGTVFISFVIGSRGLPQDVKIMKSSGHQILDEEVKKMLKKASPFPGIKGEIVIPITFKLTDSISNR
jgi:TonB family protein